MHCQFDIALQAQLSLVEPGAVVADQVRVNTYQDYPDLAQLDDLYQRQQQQEAMPTYRSGSWLAFIFSKPELGNQRLSIHCLCVLDANGKSTGEYWLKMKSAAAVAAEFNCAITDGDPARLAQQRWLDFSGGSSHFSFEQLLIEGGPDWLRASPCLQDGVIRLPTVVTPMDVPARFAGHCYVKLLSGEHSLLRAG